MSTFATVVLCIVWFTIEELIKAANRRRDARIDKFYKELQAAIDAWPSADGTIQEPSRN